VARATQVREVLRTPNFRLLYRTRLLSAIADGIFQTALASYVVFSPEKATTPAKIAAAFAALLLPYSIAGPFAGVFLDRWRRQRVLVIANTVKVALVVIVAGLVLANSAGAIFFVTAVAALGVNRLFLAALSAALPHVVDPVQLVAANALSTTSGSVATIVGAAIGAGIRIATGSSAAAVASIVLLSAIVYASSAAVAATMGRDLLGPDAEELAPDGRSPVSAATGSVGIASSASPVGIASSASPVGIASSASPVGSGSAMAAVVRDLVGATRYLWQRKRAAHALGAISAHRFLFGVASLTIVLLDRNYFATQRNVNAGILGLGADIGAVGVGIVVAALVTPPAARRFGTTTWITAMLLLGAVAIAGFGLPFQRGLLVVGSFLLGVSAQGVKICVDTTIQQEVGDLYRGRVFAVYDMLFNVTYVGAAAVTATVLPGSGRSVTVMSCLAGGYLLAAVIFAWLSRP
jgi:MFS family permease